jgi:hypothetical protein
MNSMSNVPILDAIDPEITDRLVSRRDAIAKGAAVSTTVAFGMAMASVPVALAALSSEAYGQGTALPADIKAVLDFALALEIFENEFYSAVLGISSSSAQNAAFAAVRGRTGHRAADPEARGGARRLPQGTGRDEHADRDRLRLHRRPGKRDWALCTGHHRCSVPVDGGPGRRRHRCARVQGAGRKPHRQQRRDAQRRARGSASHPLGGSAACSLALGAPDVVRLSGTIRGGGAAAAGATGSPSAAVVAAFDKIYGGATPESNTTHVVFNGTAEAAINVATLAGIQGGVNAATEAFDEPLTKAEVIAIVQPFFIPSLS